MRFGWAIDNHFLFKKILFSAKFMNLLQMLEGFVLLNIIVHV